MNEPIFCGATPEENAKMQQYFNSMHTYEQETIFQSGTKVATVEELRKCAENMTKNN